MSVDETIAREKANLEALQKSKELDRLRTDRLLKEETQAAERALDLTQAPKLEEDEFAEFLTRLAKQKAHKKERPIFLTHELNKELPLRSQQLILVGGISGRGKSTFTASLAHSMFVQKKRVLIFSTEETKNSMLARLVWIMTGIDARHYLADEGSLPEEKERLILQAVKQVLQQVKIVGLETKGQDGVERPQWVQTVDGFKVTWNNAVPQNYDLVIVDYFQKIDSYSTGAKGQQWAILKDLADFWDTEKNKPGMPPIVVLAQLKPQNSKNEISFRERIENSQQIARVATDHLELRPVPGRFETLVKFHKRRHAVIEEVEVALGFDRDRHCLLSTSDTDWLARRSKWLDRFSSLKMP